MVKICVLLSPDLWSTGQQSLQPPLSPSTGTPPLLVANISPAITKSWSFYYHCHNNMLIGTLMLIPHFLSNNCLHSQWFHSSHGWLWKMSFKNCQNHQRKSIWKVLTIKYFLYTQSSIFELETTYFHCMVAISCIYGDWGMSMRAYPFQSTNQDSIAFSLFVDIFLEFDKCLFRKKFK